MNPVGGPWSLLTRRPLLPDVSICVGRRGDAEVWVGLEHVATFEAWRPRWWWLRLLPPRLVPQFLWVHREGAAWNEALEFKAAADARTAAAGVVRARV